MIKIKFLCFCSISILLFFSCKEPVIEPSGIVICDSTICRMPHIWKSSITDDTYAYGNVTTPVVYNYGVLAMTKRNNSMFLRMLDAETGEIKWEKPRKSRGNDDFLDYNIQRAYQMDNFLINPFFGVGAIKGFENINLETGEYVWEAELSEKICFDYPVTPTGIDSLFFFCGIAKEDIPNGL